MPLLLRIRLSLILTVSVLLPCVLIAGHEKNEVEWEVVRVEKRVAAGESGVDGSFRFKNTSSRSVRVLSVTSSCGCTVGKLAKDVYAAGESGEVHAYFKADGKKGKQVNTLTVKTDAGSAPVRLEFAVDVYERMTLGTRFLVWNQGSSESKEIAIRFEDAGAVEKVEVIGGAGFTAEAKPTDDPNAWKLMVVRSSKEPLRSTCTIKAQTEKAGVLETKVFLQAR